MPALWQLYAFLFLKKLGKVSDPFQDGRIYCVNHQSRAWALEPTSVLPDKRCCWQTVCQWREREREREANLDTNAVILSCRYDVHPRLGLKLQMQLSQEPGSSQVMLDSDFKVHGNLRA